MSSRYSRLLLLSGLLLSASSLVCADTPAAQPTDEEAQKALGLVLNDTQKTDEVNLALARQMLKDSSGRAAWAQVTMYGHIARFQRFKQKDIDGALQTLEEGLAKFPREARRFDLLALKAGILNDEGKYDEAEVLLKAVWPQIIQTDLKQASSTTPMYVRTLQMQGRDQEANALVRGLFDLKLRRIGDPSNVWLFDQQVKLLTAQGREAEALQWAKLHWRVCPFNDASIASATQLLLRTWAVTDNDSSVGKAFLKAQTDKSAANPLTAVATPTWSREILQEQFGQAGSPPGVGWNAGTPTTAVSERITVLLVGGEWRKAMLMARSLMLDNPQSPDGVREACRVFKAYDGSIVRANTLVEWVKNKQGENPITEFLKEHPAPSDNPATDAPAPIANVAPAPAQ